VVFVSKDNLDKMVKMTRTIPSVKKIIVWGTSTSEEDLPKSGGDLIISYQQCLAKQDIDDDDDEAHAQPPSIHIASPPSPDDLAIVMYTSGTT
jgi:long-subunit acyl-CoA synthetase (AMP-forming)